MYSIIYSLHHGHLSDVLSFLPDALKPPKSLTVLVVGNKATIRWLIDETSETISHFQITYEIITSSGNFVLQLKRNIDGIKRSFTIRGIIPLSTYKIFMVTIGTGDVSNASATLEFTTDLPGLIYIQIVNVILLFS
jgi:hypothetical protein